MSPKGPLGNRRLTDIGPFTFDELSPPELPSGFTPPSHIDNARGDFKWWTNWKNTDKKGATILYDPDADRVIIENRLSGPEGGQYTHDDMVTDLVERSPLPRVPDRMLPAEGGRVKLTEDTIQSTLNLPTMAGGAWVVTQRLPSDKEFIENGQGVKTKWFYKVVYALKMINFPGDATVRLQHRLGIRANTIFEADRTFELGDAYLMLQFENMLPEPKEGV